MSHLLCLGFGYSAEAIAARLAPRGWRITATATTPHGVARIDRLGYRGLLFDGSRPEPALIAALAEATHVVSSIPPGPAGDPLLAHHAADLAGGPSLRFIAYFSTVGVYGDHAGAWIDEECPPAPLSERGRRRVVAEQGWLGLGGPGRISLVFRLPGIYGPGRSAIDSLRDGTARRIVKPGQVFNRIHRDDIAGAVIAAIDGSPRHRIYNVCDDEPAPPQDVVAFAAELLGLPAPPEIPFEEASLSPMGASFYAENKRVANARARGDLHWRPRYPTYREGLAAIAEGK